MRQVYEHHSKIGFRFIPNLRARIPHECGGYLVRTNSTGFRSDTEFVKTRTPGKRRMLVFGDSFTAGEGVSNGRRWTDYLEKLLPNLEVYNFGLPATGTDQHYLIYQDYAREIEHDLLVIAVFVENIRRVGSRYRHFVDDEGRKVLHAKPYFTNADGRLELHGVPVPKSPLDEKRISDAEQVHVFKGARFPALKQAFEAMRHSDVFESAFVASGLKDRVLKWSGYQPIKEYSDPAHPAWRVMRQILEEWIRNHARPVALIPIPLQQYVTGVSDPSDYRARLDEAVQAGGGTLIDPLEALSSYPSEAIGGLYFAGDHHLTAKGNEALAKAVAPQLERLLS